MGIAEKNQRPTVTKTGLVERPAVGIGQGERLEWRRWRPDEAGGRGG